MNKCTRKYLFTLFSIACGHLAISQLQPIGMWRDHLPYHSSSHIVRTDRLIYAATPYSIFSIDPADQSTKRYSRLTGLTETGVTAIAYNSSVGKLLIAYNNSDLDVLKDGLVKNIPDLMLDNITGDKTVYEITVSGNDFYLCTGIGIVVVNGSRDEIKTTWIIGSGGNKVRVNSIAEHNGSFYAATNEGVKFVTANNNPADHLNWKLLSGVNGLPAGAADKVVIKNDTVIALVHDSLYYSTGSSWSYFFGETNWDIRSIRSEPLGLMVFMKNSVTAKTLIMNVGGLISSISDPTIVQKPDDGIADNDIWIADSLLGVTRIAGTSVTHYTLNSPRSIATGDIISVGEEIIAASGGVDENWQALNNDNGIYKYSNGTWTNINRFTGAPFQFTNAHSLALSREGSLWVGTFGNGLVQIKGNNYIFFASGSAIGESVSMPGSYRVAGLAFDDGGNLWISNHGAAAAVVVRKQDGTWKQFNVPFAISGNSVSQIAVGGRNIKWIVSPGNGVIAFDDNNTIDNINDDRWRFFRAGSGGGNLPSSNVMSLAIDKQGTAWVGTDNGIALVECGSQIFDNSCEAILPIINIGGVNSYLFRGERVHAIAIDGANRKWIGTDNGAWLINQTGDQVIHHFTRSNSMLLNDTVRRISVNGTTGEAFFATNSGLISFRGNATEAVEENDLLIFPNPVPSGYTGTIAIKGLVENAIVRIVELDGRLVYQTRALGGQAVWDGRNYKGQKIASGAYLVLVTDQQRKERAAGRIIFIHTQAP